MEFDLANLLITAAIGLAGGVLGGMLGIGGSIIVIPLLSFVNGPNQQLYQATAMIMNVAVGASATLKHHLRGAIEKTMVMRLLPSALVGILLGVTLSNAIAPLTLQLIFAAFLVYIGITESISAFRREKPATDRAPDSASGSLARVSSVGGLTGIASGLLGIGGGIVVIPLLKQFCRFDMKQAIPASSATMLVTATVGATYKNIMLPDLVSPSGDPLKISDSLIMAAAMIPTAFVGSYYGAELMHRMPMGAIKKAFALLVIAAAVKMGWSALSDSLAAPESASAQSTPTPLTQSVTSSDVTDRRTERNAGTMMSARFEA